jgi:hypothetical protein
VKLPKYKKLCGIDKIKVIANRIIKGSNNFIDNKLKYIMI